MLIEGEKWACEACVRGHRVSNCQHADRNLVHIAKKGRPVSQCTHCRTLRKSRSAHVKCDCGEKVHSKGACTHAKENDPKADPCCCSHGGRCACALKKEHLDPVPESDSDEGSSCTPPNARPRAQTLQGEGLGLTVFTNGHHKPAHKHNQMAHKCGTPYVVPRAHSIHGSTGLANRSVDNLPHTSTVDALHSDSHIKDSIVSAQQQQRMVKSEHNSPLMGAVSTLDQLNVQIPPLNLSGLESFEYNFPVNYDGLPTIADIEQPIFSAGLSATSVDWSHYDGLDFNSNDNFTTSEFSHAQSFTGYDFSSVDQPALTTTSTSGEISEVEDYGPFSDPMSNPQVLVTQQYGSDFDASDLGDDNYRLSTASSYLGLPQAQMLANNDVASLDIDEFLKGVANNSYAPVNNDVTGFEDPKFVPTSASYEEGNFGLPNDEEEGLWMQDFSSNNLPLENGISEGSDNIQWVR